MKKITISDVETILKEHKFKRLKRITKTTKLAVLVTYDIKKATEDIKKILEPFGGKFVRKTNLSSNGHIEISGISVVARPFAKQGIKSAGLQNEKLFGKSLNVLIRDVGGCCDILLKSKKSEFLIKDAKGTRLVGKQTTGRKKADILIRTKTKQIPISIKKDTAEIWESADKYYGRKAKKNIKELIDSGEIEIKEHERKKGVFSIEPKVAFQASYKEKKDVMFGSDILTGNGCIIQKSFTEKDFNYDGETHTIIVTVSDIIEKPSDAVNTNADPHFLIRNDSTRKSEDIGIPGIRVLAIYKKGITKTTKVVK
jgi:hypothetical protein